MNWARVILVAAVFLLASASVQANDNDPSKIIQTTAGRVMDMLNAQREYYIEHPEELNHVVEHEVLPIFDLIYAARLILGRHGRGASQRQLQDFADAMSQLLIRRYADGVLQFQSKNQLEVLPLVGKNTARLTRVRTRVRLENGSKAPVDYAFRRTDGGWKVFDVTVEGISYITTYRNQIGPQVQQDGIDGVIEKLRNGNITLNEG